MCTTEHVYTSILNPRWQNDSFSASRFLILHNRDEIKSTRLSAQTDQRLLLHHCLLSPTHSFVIQTEEILQQDHWTKHNITFQMILILGKQLFMFNYVNVSKQNYLFASFANRLLLKDIHLTGMAQYIHNHVIPLILQHFFCKLLSLKGTICKIFVIKYLKTTCSVKYVMQLCAYVNPEKFQF